MAFPLQDKEKLFASARSFLRENRRFMQSVVIVWPNNTKYGILSWNIYDVLPLQNTPFVVQ